MHFLCSNVGIIICAAISVIKRCMYAGHNQEDALTKFTTMVA